MPKIPVNPEQLSGALGALRRAISNSPATHPSTLPTIVQRQLTTPAHIEEAVAHQPPDLENPGRRELLKRAAVSAVSSAADSSPLALIAKTLADTTPSKVFTDPEIGDKLATWFGKALTKVKATPKDLEGNLYQDSETHSPYTRQWLSADGRLDGLEGDYPDLADHLGIQDIHDLATQVGVPAHQLGQYLLENADDLSKPGSTVKDLVNALGDSHMVNALNHEYLLTDGMPRDFHDHTSLWHPDNLQEAHDHTPIEDYTDEMDYFNDFEDTHRSAARMREFPLQSRIFGPGLDRYIDESTEFPKVEDAAYDSLNLSDDVLDSAMDRSADHDWDEGE